MEKSSPPAVALPPHELVGETAEQLAPKLADGPLTITTHSLASHDAHSRSPRQVKVKVKVKVSREIHTRCVTNDSYI
jgi:hypothetical protein